MPYNDVMIKRVDLEKLEHWTGDIGEFARAAGALLSSLGVPDQSSGPNIRVIRDYAQRGIISRAERQGKESVYGFRQLIEFVAARLLIADGWPLAKIAEHFAHIADGELLNLISGEGGGNRALSVAKRLRSETSGHGKSPPQASAEFRQRAARLTGIQAEMRDALRRLGLPEDGPAVEQVTLLAVAPWCQVLIESRRLSRVTLEEAEEIGRAVTASLLTVARKGTKS